MPPSSPVVRFGAFELDVRAGELRKRGLKIRLADQPLHILLLLLERPGDVLTREELRGKLWPADTFVDFDVGLSSAVRKLRDALGDSADNPQFIETLPRRGYRFIAPVIPAVTASDGGARLQSREDAGAPAVSEPPAPAALTAARGHTYWWAGAAALAVMLAAVAGYRLAPWGRMPEWREPAGINALVVLPLENLTGDPSQDYFADGMTDALTTDLAEAGTLQVISRTSAMHYKGTEKSARDIGQELNVDGVLEGAVARSGQHVRITVQLIQAATDRHVWARSYEADVTDMVALQERIARAVVSAIGGRLAGAAASTQRWPVNADAYDAYLKGVAAEGRSTYEGYRTAVAYFEEAVAKQPDYAEAWAEMAQAQTQFLYVGPLSPREVMPKAEAAARKAVQIDEQLALGHRTLGMILHDFYWHWKEADEELRRARELTKSTEAEPIGAQALSRAHRFDEAIAQAERNLARDPLSFNAYINVATVYRATHQYDRAIAEFRRALELSPDQPRGHFQIAVTLLEMGHLNDAIGELETAVASSKGNPRFHAYLGYAYAKAGRRGDARSILKHLEARRHQQYVSSFGIALIYDALGEKDAALAAFERAYDDRAVEFSQMTQWPPFETIASDPRFKGPMRAIELRP